MLGKLLKYEFKATTRILVPMFCALPLLAALARLFIFVAERVHELFAIPAVMVNLLYSVASIAAGVGLFVVVVLRFYRNLTGDEGYLMMTLPVKTTTHINAKLIAGLAWHGALLVAIGLSFVALTAGTPWRDMAEGLRMMFDSAEITMFFSRGGGWIIAEFVAVMLLSAVASILTCYAAVAMGPHLLKNRALGSILVYVIISVALNILATLAMVFIGIIGIFAPNFVSSLAQMLSTMGGAALFLGIIGVLTVLQGVLFYWLTWLFLEKKLNLA